MSTFAFNLSQKLLSSNLFSAFLSVGQFYCANLISVSNTLTSFSFCPKSKGKQKRHTFKNQFIVLPKGRDIVDVVVGKPGPTSDIKICRQTLNRFDSQQVFCGDKAYVGEAQIITPSKKPKNGELSQKQKEENKVLSSNRVFVEHLITGQWEVL